MTKVISIHRKLRIQNRYGLHARPAADFVLCAQKFNSEINLIVGRNSFSGTRVIDVLLANLAMGTEFTIVATGVDAQAAIDALTAFVTTLHREA